jgi:hypothetical protein
MKAARWLEPANKNDHLAFTLKTRMILSVDFPLTEEIGANGSGEMPRYFSLDARSISVFGVARN